MDKNKLIKKKRKYDGGRVNVNEDDSLKKKVEMRVKIKNIYKVQYKLITYLLEDNIA